MLQPASSVSTSQRVFVATVLSVGLVAGTMVWGAIQPIDPRSRPTPDLHKLAGDVSRIALTASALPHAPTIIRHPENMPDGNSNEGETSQGSVTEKMEVAAISPPEFATTPSSTNAAPPLAPGRGLDTDQAGGSENLVLTEDPDTVQERYIVRQGDTLMNILLRAGIPRAEAHEAVNSLQGVYDPRRLRVGQHLDLELQRAAEQPDGTKLAVLSINLDFSNDLRLARAPQGGFDVETAERQLVHQTIAASSVIEDSLYVAARRAGVSDEALMELIRLFSWDVDFQHDVHAGDAFSIAYDEVATPDGEQHRVDKLEYASLTIQGRNLEAYRFRDSRGIVGYYDSTGRSLRKWLMRTPVDGARLSSGFGKRRHPILGYTRMHKGVDFAAPKGTPIYAAGDGVITKIGRNGGYGNFIQIRHNKEYSTAYGHMNGFAKNLKKGSRVKQGEAIGYVGSTGRSTGPHLHYEVLENGIQINPMKVKKQVITRLEGSDLTAFKKRVAQVIALMEESRKDQPVLANND
ncbi:MAG: peptidoglycan DD-metalloendopeptidase family protein [Geminicoccaceae bacterium]|nr:peptidoglycan DD-metalloendopeptidase family protein [Geminicoccaceae bacterium]